VKSLKDRLTRKFNVAVAEIDYQDLWQRSLVSAVTVSGDHAHAEQVLQRWWSAKPQICWAAWVGSSTEWIERGIQT
jgi:uncharacterized protein YlxP (DUF503 family)